MKLTDSSRDGLVLKRRLRSWQIFFISFGGVVGIGFFRGSSTTLAVSGPVGALIATVAVGLIAVIVMEAICELINIWPIPNAMVEYVRIFVDEDLGVAIGILYWYTYCITFSALVIAVGDLADYWATGDSLIAYPLKALMYVCVPLLLLLINALPVKYYGWIEFIGGVIKLVLILGTVILMICINLGVGYDGYIGAKYFEDAVQNNEHVASSHAVAVFASIPKAIFAYIGVELLTTTAFEARDPSDLQFPARNIGWCSLVMYALATGSFVANVSWQDPQLPKLFQQALTTITDPTIHFEPIRPNAHAAPLIALLRLNFRFLPGFLNACFIYSALSCANTALYVASRQLYGLTRSIDVDRDSNWLRRFCAWIGSVDHRTKSPWIALFISVLLTCWVPFIRRHEALFLREVQDVLTNLGSVSCILVWCSQCIAYILFFHWRELHITQIKNKARYESLLDQKKVGWLRVFQPYLSYVGAIATFLIVFFFNTASMWNGDQHTLTLKALSAFISPAVLLLIYLIKKFTRPKNQQRFFNNLSDWPEFEKRINYLNDLIYPGESSIVAAIKETGVTVSERSAPRPTSRENPRVTSWSRGDLTLIDTNHGGMIFDRTDAVSPMPPVSPLQSGEAVSSQGQIGPSMNLNQDNTNILNAAHPPQAVDSSMVHNVSKHHSTQMMHSGYMRPSNTQSQPRSHPHSPSHSHSNGGAIQLDPAHHSDSFLSRTRSGAAFNNNYSRDMSVGLSPEWSEYNRNDLTRNMSNVSELGEGDGGENARERERDRGRYNSGSGYADESGGGSRMYELPSFSLPVTRAD